MAERKDAAGKGTIRSDRLLLEPAGRERLEAERTGGDVFAAAIDAVVPDSWPMEDLREVLPLFIDAFRRRPEAAVWYGWHWILEEGGRRFLVGGGGFHGPPDRKGRAEIGYAVAPSFRGRGFASEGTAALLGWAFARPETRRIDAETDAGNAPSIRVLEKNRFLPARRSGEGGRIWFSLGRERFLSV